jgi:hypothetical protein
MNTLDTRLMNRRSLIAIVVFMFLLAAAFGLASGVAQTPAKEERAVEDRVAKHLPVKVKVKNEQSLKDVKNKKWARELEVEVKNTGDKPIYYVYVVIVMRDVLVEGYPLSMRTAYGRKELGLPETAAEPGDVPIQPGETVTLKLPEGQVSAYEQSRDGKARPDPKRLEIEVLMVNFGDGTSFVGREGMPVQATPKKQSSNDSTPKKEAKLCKPDSEESEGESPGSLIKALYISSPAKFLRANLYLADELSALPPAPRRDLCGCQSTSGCMWGMLDYPECPCDNNREFTSVSPAGGCAATGFCYRVEVVRQECHTQYNGTQICTYDDPIGSCRIGDPTPTPTPTSTPTPGPTPTPTPTPLPCPQPAPATCCQEHYFPPAPGSPPPPCQWDCGQGACPANQQLNNGCYVKSSANCAQGYAPAQSPGIINTLCCPGPQPTPTPTPPIVSTCPNPVNYAFYPSGGCPVGSANNGAGCCICNRTSSFIQQCTRFGGYDPDSCNCAGCDTCAGSHVSG